MPTHLIFSLKQFYLCCSERIFFGWDWFFSLRSNAVKHYHINFLSDFFETLPTLQTSTGNIDDPAIPSKSTLSMYYIPFFLGRRSHVQQDPEQLSWTTNEMQGDKAITDAGVLQRDTEARKAEWRQQYCRAPYMKREQITSWDNQTKVATLTKKCRDRWKNDLFDGISYMLTELLTFLMEVTTFWRLATYSKKQIKTISSFN